MLSLVIVGASLAVLAGITGALIRANARHRRRAERREAGKPSHVEYIAVIEERLAVATVERARTHPPLGARCPFCTRRLRSVQGLTQHERASHGVVSD